jgi:hypothetical protein
MSDRVTTTRLLTRCRKSLDGLVVRGVFRCGEKRREHSDTGELRGVMPQLDLVAYQPDAVVSRALIKKPAGTVTAFALLDAGDGRRGVGCRFKPSTTSCISRTSCYWSRIRCGTSCGCAGLPWRRRSRTCPISCFNTRCCGRRSSGRWCSRRSTSTRSHGSTSSAGPSCSPTTSKDSTTSASSLSVRASSSR